MKKLFRFLPALMIAAMGVAATGCDDDKDEIISSEKLPATAQEFIIQYFPTAQIASTEKDGNDYEVLLSEGTRIEFNRKGVWQDVEAPFGKTVPSGFYPEGIDTYVQASFDAGVGVNEISKDNSNYDVELTTGTELRFNSQGVFIGFDR